MASEISLLLATETLHASLPLTSATSLYKTFQSLFLIECPNDDANTLRNIQLNAAFLEYLSTQHSSRIKQLLYLWHSQKMKAEQNGAGEENTQEANKEMVKEVDYTAAIEILDSLESYIRDGVNEICVYFEGQEAEAIVKTEEVRRKVAGILNLGTSWFRPRVICQPREVV
ncbi:hypothetical protein BKA65DRAFT_513377 [Rhexocercosporidium sp. MPI-PUGE-AT-0058]|nr:hypothetical protein BKA65DRAFT_513377 [Rhexocercosporidium sp. MPI-PUGE-AT-0058]